MKVVSKVWSAIVTIIVILALALAVLLAGVRVIGYTPYAVLTGSMTPTYLPGDLVYVKKVPQQDIKVGDVVTCVIDQDLTLVTHRVHSIDPKTGFFYTKGDANEDVDATPRDYKNIVGVVKFSLPKLGIVSNFFNDKRGKYFAVMGALLVILLIIIAEIIKPEEAKEQKVKGDGGSESVSASEEGIEPNASDSSESDSSANDNL